MKKINKKTAILGLILGFVIIGGSATAFLSLGKNTPSRNNNSTDEKQLLEILTKPVAQSASALGAAKANITLIEFGDYQCQYCARFHSETRGQLINNYVMSGDVKLLFKDFVINDKPSDKASTLAAVGSYCAADQGKYWQFHDEVYSNSKGENVKWVTSDSLKQFASNVGIPDLTKFSNCLESQKYINLVAENDHLARSIGLTSTPTFILVSPGKKPLEIVGDKPYAAFEQAIKEMQT